MSRLYESLPLMTNKEVNNLAKNKYVDEDIQQWISEFGGIQARYSLARNRDICPVARDILLKGKSNLVKGLLVGSNNVRDTSIIRDIYSKFRHKPTSYNWRIYNYFIRDLWNRGFYTNSPSDVLEDIYENRMYTTGRAEFYSRHWVRELSHHPNCSIKLAIIMSQSEYDHNKNCGFEALVRLEKQNKNL